MTRPVSGHVNSSHLVSEAGTSSQLPAAPGWVTKRHSASAGPTFSRPWSRNRPLSPRLPGSQRLLPTWPRPLPTQRMQVPSKEQGTFLGGTCTLSWFLFSADHSPDSKAGARKRERGHGSDSEPPSAPGSLQHAWCACCKDPRGKPDGRSVFHLRSLRLCW